MSMSKSVPSSGASDAFLQPESMVTPGALGALVMLITNSLAPLIDVDKRWVGLALAFVCGSIAIVKAPSVLQKAIFYIINSLIIFSVAAGTNQFGVAAGDRSSASGERHGMLEYLIAGRAVAQTANQNDMIQNLPPSAFFTPWFPQGTTRGIKIGPSLTGKDWSVIVGAFDTKLGAEEKATQLGSASLPKKPVKVVQLPNAVGKWGVLVVDDADISTATARRDRVTRLGIPVDQILVWDSRNRAALPPPE